MKDRGVSSMANPFSGTMIHWIIISRAALKLAELLLWFLSIGSSKSGREKCEVIFSRALIKAYTRGIKMSILHKESNWYLVQNFVRLLPTIVILMSAVAPLPSASARSEAGIPQVVVGSAKMMPVFDEIPLSGTVTSPRAAKLSTEVSGLVKTIVVDAGDRVKTGDVLLTLDPELGELELEAARAVTEQARQELADAGRRLADAKKLANRQVISTNELQSLEAEVRVDTAAVRRYMAEQQRQEARMRRHRLLAPFTGVISRKSAETGEWIQPGDTVVDLIATDGLRIDFQAPQAVFTRVTMASEVRVRLDALPDKLFAGIIQTIVPVNDPNARAFLLRVTLGDTGAAMVPGMSASGLLRLQSDAEGVVVSRDALLRYPDGRVTVWVVNDDGERKTVTERQVKTGTSFNGQVAVIQGLDAGVQVVLQGNEALRQGQTVAIRRNE
jgi:RND family efflux transporter MFP subunit